MGYSHLRERRGVLYLPGVSGNYASTPDSAALDITGDIDIRVHADFQSSIDAGATVTLISKWNGSGDQRSWRIFVTSTGALSAVYSGDGITSQTAQTAVIDWTSEDTWWVRVTIDLDNGSGNSEVKFYRGTDGASWTLLGTKTASTLASLYASTATLDIGAVNAGTFDVGPLKVYRAQVLDGIAGTAVADVTFAHPPTAWTVDGTTGVDENGNVWTINGTKWEWRE